MTRVGFGERPCKLAKLKCVYETADLPASRLGSCDTGAIDRSKPIATVKFVQNVLRLSRLNGHQN